MDHKFTEQAANSWFFSKSEVPERVYRSSAMRDVVMYTKDHDLWENNRIHCDVALRKLLAYEGKKSLTYSAFCKRMTKHFLDD